jgi:TPR repeat protein
VPSTEDGLPLIGIGGGDPDLIRRRIVEARQLADPDERAARLYFLGCGLFDCDDAPLGAVEDAVAVLHEAMELGSSHAALELGRLWLADASSAADIGGALALIERAARADLVEAQVLLGNILLESPVTREAGERWLARASAVPP